MKETSHRSYVLVSSYEMYKLGKSMDRAERPGDGRKGDGKGHRGGVRRSTWGSHIPLECPLGPCRLPAVAPSSLGSVYASRPALSYCCFFIDWCLCFCFWSVLGLRGCTEQGLLSMASHGCRPQAPGFVSAVCGFRGPGSWALEPTSLAQPGSVLVTGPPGKPALREGVSEAWGQWAGWAQEAQPGWGQQGPRPLSTLSFFCSTVGFLGHRELMALRFQFPVSCQASVCHPVVWVRASHPSGFGRLRFSALPAP